MLQSPADTNPPTSGIPMDDALRSQTLSRATVQQQGDAGGFVRRVQSWQVLDSALQAMSAAGVPVVVPAGDAVYRVGQTVLPTLTQSVYGVAARSDVITVGAAHQTGLDAATGKPIFKINLASGTGPTLGLRPKPDLLARSDVLGMVPVSSTIGGGWDAATSLPTGEVHQLQWQDPDQTEEDCPAAKVTGQAMCVLAGSTVIASAVAAANLATLVAQGRPHLASARTATDDEVLRGIAQARASQSLPPLAASGDRTAYPWEMGAGVLDGFASFWSDAVPTIAVPLKPVDFGEVGWNSAATLTVPLWCGGTSCSPSVSASFSSFLGPTVDQQSTGTARAATFTRSVTATLAGNNVTLSLAAAKFQGGLYAGSLDIGGYDFPASAIQDLDLDFVASYAYDAVSTRAVKPDWTGERAEDVTVALLPGMPVKQGVFGRGFKFLSPTSSAICSSTR